MESLGYVIQNIETRSSHTGTLPFSKGPGRPVHYKMLLLEVSVNLTGAPISNKVAMGGRLGTDMEGWRIVLWSDGGGHGWGRREPCCLIGVPISNKMAMELKRQAGGASFEMTGA